MGIVNSAPATQRTEYYTKSAIENPTKHKYS